MPNRNQVEYIDLARLSLWEKVSKNDKKFLSGVVEFEDGRKMHIRIFRNEHPKGEKSPKYYGFAQVPETEAHKFVASQSKQDLVEDNDFGF